MFTVKVTVIEGFPELGHRYASYVRIYSHRSPKVAAERVWRQRGKYVGKFQPPYGGTPVMENLSFYNGTKLTSSTWD